MDKTYGYLAGGPDANWPTHDLPALRVPPPESEELHEARACLHLVLDATRDSEDGWSPHPAVDETFNEDAHVGITLTVGELRRINAAVSWRAPETTDDET